ncbi:MAG: type II toxin-antitoxin system RelE/ParE family toxin [Flammeovirgaceae bacterium]|nr:type II toxin-antitoxin system RelE/ParE family toxin [Flammeovirgaceae bacterium]
MEYTLVFHPLAEAEYTESFLWYEKQLKGLGERFEQSVEKKLNQIVSKPLLFPKKKSVFREVKVGAFPYMIVYYVSERQKMVFISSIFHTSRSPKKKFRRKKPG